MYASMPVRDTVNRRGTQDHCGFEPVAAVMRCRTRDAVDNKTMRCGISPNAISRDAAEKIYEGRWRGQCVCGSVREIFQVGCPMRSRVTARGLSSLPWQPSVPDNKLQDHFCEAFHERGIFRGTTTIAVIRAHIDQVAAQIGKTALDKRVLRALDQGPSARVCAGRGSAVRLPDRAAADWLR